MLAKISAGMGYFPRNSTYRAYSAANGIFYSMGKLKGGAQ
jgi:hypothetical protein